MGDQQKDELIERLKLENSELKRRVSRLESQLLEHGILQEEEEAFLSGQVMHSDSASTISRVSVMDGGASKDTSISRKHFSSLGLGEETNTKKLHDQILDQVLQRRFTLTQEKRIHKREKWRESNKSLMKNLNKNESFSEESKDAQDSPSNQKHKVYEMETAIGSTGSKAPVYQLPRGGVYVQTSKGPLQFGIPPETIKDCMKLGLDVPKYFVVPKDRFNLKLGLNMCEVEFPGYFNFFLKQSSVNLVASPDTEEIVRKVIGETLEGPEEKYLYVDQEYPTETEKSGRFSFAARPNHVKEINFFKEPRNGRKICTDTLVQFDNFLPFQSVVDKLSKEAANVANTALQVAMKISKQSKGEDEKSCEGDDTTSPDNSEAEKEDSCADSVLVAILNNGLEIVDCGSEYVVVDDGTIVARVQSFLSAWAPSQKIFTGGVPATISDPPQFGVTVIGSSHGFDPNGSTSGFVLWIHKKGIMVDPPPNATEILQAAGIIPSMITGIILTHCHADHDAGTFQKILKEGRITLITTQTILDSFIRKYSIISGFAERFLLRLFEHRVVKVGELVHWGGGTLRFFYSLHALPCIGFEAMVAGKTFAYSADTYYDPKGLVDLRDKGYLSNERCDALLDFPWDYDLVLHEAGIPPIHTSVDSLLALPESVQKNLYIIHIAEGKAKESGLRLAKAGVENTIIIETPSHEHATSAAILQLLRSTAIFRHFSISQASDLLQICRHCSYKPGDYICRVGEVGKHFFVILSGFCEVKLDNSRNDGNDLHESLRKEDARNIVQKVLDPKAEEISEPVETERSTSSSSLKSTMSGSSSCSAEVEQPQSKIFGPGDYLGEQALLTENKIRSADIVASTTLSLIKLDNNAFRYLLDTTPGLQYRMERLSKIRLSTSWKAIGSNSVLSQVGSSQRSQLQAVMQVVHVKAGTKIWRRNRPVERAYLLAGGQLEFLEMRDELETPFKAGSFFCNVASMMSVKQSKEAQMDDADPVTSARSRPSSPPVPHLPHAGSGLNRDASRGRSFRKKRIINSRVTLVAKTDADLYYIEASDILEFLDLNPGIFINLIDSLVIE